MVRILRINMANGTATEEQLRDERLFWGGRFLTSKVLLEEVPPTCHPLGRRNKLIFAGGPLAGTLVSSANRLSIGAKSPLTGTTKESNAGGTTAYMLGRLSIRALILEDKPAENSPWRVLVVNHEGVRLDNADDLAGLDTGLKAEKLRQRYGAKVAMSIIGPVGERLQLTAGIASVDTDGEPSRYSGRGGLGAVMGSRRLLAVVVDASAAPKESYADREAFMQANRELARRIAANPQTREVYRDYGTAALVEQVHALGGLPTCNFRTGHFAQAESISGQALHDTILERGGEGAISHACMPGCLLRCSNIYPDKQGKKLCSPIEFENIGLLGSNLGIGCLDTVAQLNAWCNRLGCDTIEVGAAIGVAMDAGLLPFGDGDAALSVMRSVAEGDALGRIIASGAGVTGKVFGCTRVPVVKNQAMAAYDPRAIKGLGVTYATSPQGADHTVGSSARAKVAQHEKEGKVALSRGAQHTFAAMDALGCCIMLLGADPLPVLAELASTRYSSTLDVDGVRALAAQTLDMERAFNKAAGFGPMHDDVPEFFRDEVNEACGVSFDLSVEEMQEATR